MQFLLILQNEKQETFFSSSEISPSILDFCNTFSNIDSVSLNFSRNYLLSVLRFLKLKWPSKNLKFNFVYNSNAVSFQSSPSVKSLIKNDNKV